MSHKQWHSCALVKTILHIANDAESRDEQCLSTFPDPVLMMMSLNIADGAVFWCLYQECSWLHTSDLRVVMTSEDQTPIGRWWFCSECKIWDRQLADRQTDRPRDVIYCFIFMFYHLFNWRYEGQRSPSRMFVDDRNLLLRKSLPRRIQAVNRDDLS